MAEYLIQDSTLEDIADALRAKKGMSDRLTPLEMPDSIAAIVNHLTGYKNAHADGYVPKGTGSDSKTFSISITGTRGKRHKLYGAHALSTSTSSTVHTPVISDALTDVTNGVTITTEGDTVTYTWEWTVAITRSSSASKYYKTSTLLILMEE